MHPKLRRVNERVSLLEKLRAIAGLVATHNLCEADDAMVIGALRGIAFRIAELDAETA
jgi:hypothetical protein